MTAKTFHSIMAALLALVMTLNSAVVAVPMPPAQAAAPAATLAMEHSTTGS
jgi:hypothetical protein